MIEKSIIHINNTLISDNEAKQNGGGIYMYKISHLTLQNSKLLDNFSQLIGSTLDSQYSEKIDILLCEFDNKNNLENRKEVV